MAMFDYKMISRAAAEANDWQMVKLLEAQGWSVMYKTTRYVYLRRQIS